ncbi:hypothetical protein GW17_00056276 [Ensete ventricosum]|nr:hypothetical protein GW17_00056276 [Ensete ventricosum]
MRGDVSSPREACAGRRNLPVKPGQEAIAPREARVGEKKRCFLLLAIAKDSPQEVPRSLRARIGIGRAGEDLQVLPLLLSLLTETARNRLTTIEIDRYHPTAAGDDRNRLLPTDFGWYQGGNIPNRSYHPVAGGPRTTPNPKHQDPNLETEGTGEDKHLGRTETGSGDALTSATAARLAGESKEDFAVTGEGEAEEEEVEEAETWGSWRVLERANNRQTFLRLFFTKRPERGCGREERGGRETMAKAVVAEQRYTAETSMSLIFFVLLARSSSSL